MKKITLVGTTLVLALVAGGAAAATPAKTSGSIAAPASTSSGGGASSSNSLSAGTMGLNIALGDKGVSGTGTSNDFIISGKYFIAKDMALIAGLGLGINGGDAKGTDLGFTVGARKYLKSDDLAPFVGARFAYSTTGDSAMPGGKTVTLGLLAEAGAEYFLSKQFSLEGRVGFGYLSAETTTGAAAAFKGTRIGTESLGISANFYF